MLVLAVVQVLALLRVAPDRLPWARDTAPNPGAAWAAARPAKGSRAVASNETGPELADDEASAEEGSGGGSPATEPEGSDGSDSGSDSGSDDESGESSGSASAGDEDGSGSGSDGGSDTGEDSANDEGSVAAAGGEGEEEEPPEPPKDPKAVKRAEKTLDQARELAAKEEWAKVATLLGGDLDALIGDRPEFWELRVRSGIQAAKPNWMQVQGDAERLRGVQPTNAWASYGKGLALLNGRKPDVGAALIELGKARAAKTPPPGVTSAYYTALAKRYGPFAGIGLGVLVLLIVATVKSRRRKAAEAAKALETALAGGEPGAPGGTDVGPTAGPTAAPDTPTGAAGMAAGGGLPAKSPGPSDKGKTDPAAGATGAEGAPGAATGGKPGAGGSPTKTPAKPGAPVPAAPPASATATQTAGPADRPGSKSASDSPVNRPVAGKPADPGKPAAPAPAAPPPAAAQAAVTMAAESQDRDNGNGEAAIPADESVAGALASGDQQSEASPADDPGSQRIVALKQRISAATATQLRERSGSGGNVTQLVGMAGRANPRGPAHPPAPPLTPAEAEQRWRELVTSAERLPLPPMMGPTFDELIGGVPSTTLRPAPTPPIDPGELAGVTIDLSEAALKDDLLHRLRLLTITDGELRELLKRRRIDHLPHLINYIRSRPDPIRLAFLARELGQYRDPGVTDILATLLYHEDARVVLGAIQGMEINGDAGAILHLCPFVRSENQVLFEAAKKALASFGPRVIMETLLGLPSIPDPRLKSGAVFVLARMKGEPVTKLMIELLGDPCEQVRLEVIDAMAWQGNPAYLEPLRQHYRRTKGEHEKRLARKAVVYLQSMAPRVPAGGGTANPGGSGGAAGSGGPRSSPQSGEGGGSRALPAAGTGGPQTQAAPRSLGRTAGGGPGVRAGR